MKVVISGASGMIGSRLTADLSSSGIEVLRLVRTPAGTPRGSTAEWQPARGELDPRVLAGAHAIVNLSGRNIGEGRWTPRVKEELRSSRLDATATLAAALARAERPPRLLINASATGYYGDRGEEALDETSAPGEGFLAELCRSWEERAEAAGSEATRVVVLRFGVVVGPGGALTRMLTPFKLGMGGPIGSGRQWWSWVAIDDVVGVIRFVLEHPTASGPLNVVAPESARCADFARALGRVLHRPAALPLPAAVARLALGEMAEALLLASAKVRPAALERLGYTWRVADLEEAFRRALD